MSSEPGSGLRVLVVDDEFPIAFSLSQVLQRAGYATQTATAGREALKLAASFMPDLLLTDYAMPGMDGLSLAVEVKKMLPACRIVLLSGHELAVPSTPYAKKGYKFALLSKPLHPESLLNVLQDQMPATSAQVRPKILHVDDVEPHRYSLTRMLEHAGFEVITASNGSEAIALALHDSPDLVLLDIHLPDINGFEVCKRIKENPETSQLMIVHLTATAVDSESAAKSASAGADGFLTEPFIPAELVAKLRSYLQVRYMAG